MQEVLGGLLKVFHVGGAGCCAGGAGWFAEGVSRWRCRVLPLEVPGGLLKEVTTLHYTVGGAMFYPGGAGWFADGVSR